MSRENENNTYTTEEKEIIRRELANCYCCIVLIAKELKRSPRGLVLQLMDIMYRTENRPEPPKDKPIKIYKDIYLLLLSTRTTVTKELFYKYTAFVKSEKTQNKQWGVCKGHYEAGTL